MVRELKTNYKMRNIIYILFISVMTLTGCSEDFELEDIDLSGIELPAYVAFTAPGLV